MAWGEGATAGVPLQASCVVTIALVHQRLPQLAARHRPSCPQQDMIGGAAAEGEPAGAAEPLGPEQQLALRAAHAMEGRNCANPSCASLAGPTDSTVKGKRCARCNRLRLCSLACQQDSWPLHRKACRRLCTGA